jgi:aminoglycoside phosphotransferase (APT) family kinase protein
MSGYHDRFRQSIDFDPDRLAARLGGGDVSIQRISGGQSNPTYFVDHGGRRMVLRKPPAGNTLPSAHAVDREHRIMAAVGAAGFPVPEMILLEEDPEPIGTPFYLMERLDGRVFHDSALPDLSIAERTVAFRDTARTLAQLHSLDWHAEGLEGFGRPGGYFDRQIARWTRQWGLSKTRDDENIEMLCTWLADNVPADDRTTIVHGDYRIGNIMFAPDAPRIIGVLDWELSTLGHPLADVAHIGTFWDFDPHELGGIAGLDHAALGLPSRDAFIGEYLQAGGCDTPITPFHRAFALFRYAVIFEGIAARYKSGNAAGDNAMSVGALSAACAAKAINALSSDST